MAKGTVKKLDEAGLIIDETLYKQAQDNPDAHLRMVAGAEKYGRSWAEVDLKTDLLEELYDSLNYPLMMAVRIFNANDEYISLEEWETVCIFRDKVKDLIEYVELFFPDFEGPTSAEYVNL